MSRVDASVGLNSEVQQAIVFLDQLFPAPRHFDIRFWDGTTLPGEGRSEFTISLNSPGALRRMFQIPVELRLGEAYLFHDFDIDGDSMAMVYALYTAARAGIFTTVGQVTTQSTSFKKLLSLVPLWLQLPRDSQADEPVTRPVDRGRATVSGKQHTRERDKQAVPYHYNAGNDFYALWLGQRMVYSGAYFPTGTEDIDQAQESKLDYICRKLALKSGDRLLDIGCGWGGLIIYAAQKYGVNSVGVTLSQDQYQLASQRIAASQLTGQVSVRLLDYRDLKGETFDKIVSVGMFEHVGHSALPGYFKKAYELLRPGGLFLNQGTSSGSQWDITGLQGLLTQWLLGRWEFGRHYVFPDGELMPISESNLMAERAGFEVRDVESIREHFVLTLQHWLHNLEAHRDEAIRIAGEMTYRVWLVYLSAALIGFESGTVNEYQSLLGKPTDGQVDLPLTRADLYR